MNLRWRRGDTNVWIASQHDPVFGTQTRTGVDTWGRTNLKPYFNLNFDPNDAVTAGVGWHGENGRMVSLLVVADDRLHTGQRDWHLATRWPLAPDGHTALDLLRKTGQGDGGPCKAGAGARRWTSPPD